MPPASAAFTRAAVLISIGQKLCVPVLDLTNLCADKYEALGRETVDKFYSDHNHTYVPGADFVPVFLSDVPGLFLSGAVKLGVALLQLSPPDRTQCEDRLREHRDERKAASKFKRFSDGRKVWNGKRA